MSDSVSGPLSPPSSPPSGLDVRVTSRGVPRQLASAADQAAYRILQEALTNTARHGTGAARVELVFDEAALELTISNPASGESPAKSNGGHDARAHDPAGRQLRRRAGRR
jgi:signal transduction histidine kinase